MKSRVAQRPVVSMPRPAGTRREEGAYSQYVTPLCSQRPTQLRRDASRVECSGGFTTGAQGVRLHVHHHLIAVARRAAWRRSASATLQARAPPARARERHPARVRYANSTSGRRRRNSPSRCARRTGGSGPAARRWRPECGRRARRCGRPTVRVRREDRPNVWAGDLAAWLRPDRCRSWELKKTKVQWKWFQEAFSIITCCF